MPVRFMNVAIAKLWAVEESAKRQLVGMRLGIRHQFAETGDGQCATYGHRHGNNGNLADGRKAGRRVPRQAWDRERGNDLSRQAREHQRVSVRLRTKGTSQPDGAAGADAVVDHGGLTECFRHVLSQHARSGVGR